MVETISVPRLLVDVLCLNYISLLGTFFFFFGNLIRLVNRKKKTKVDLQMQQVPWLLKNFLVIVMSKYSGKDLLGSLPTQRLPGFELSLNAEALLGPTLWCSLKLPAREEPL